MNAIIQGDALDILRGFPEATFDLIFADPPYNIGKKYKNDRDRIPPEEYYAWCGEWIFEGYRVLKDSGSFYLKTIPRHLKRLFPLMRGEFVNQIIWRNVSSYRNVVSFWTGYEPILFFAKTPQYKFNRYAQRRINGDLNIRWTYDEGDAQGQLLDIWDDIPFVFTGSVKHPEAILEKGSNRKLHPCQMPIALARRAIEFSTDYGDLVLDLFSGSGSTAVAAVETNRESVSIEIESTYIELIKRRLGEAQIGLKL